MGGEPYYYFVPYQKDIEDALQALRRREFEAGRYNPAMPFLSRHFPLGPNSPAPGRKHDSIEDALEDSDADGTRSILDIERISDSPDFSVASKIPDDVEEDMALLEDIERGHCIYLVLYEGDTPSEILCAGYSYD
jgi:hypothetical protein